jgi:hypothetical protein
MKPPKEPKPVKVYLKYSDVKSTSRPVNRDNYMLLVKIWQTIHYSEKRKTPISKVDLIFKYGKHKDVVEKIWICVYDLKIEWPFEMYDRVFEN